jgi:prevent-host-death family protein
MTKISVTELKINAGKYVDMAQEQDIFITKNGKMVAKLVNAKADKAAAAKALFGALPIDADIDLDKIREERLGL